METMFCRSCQLDLPAGEFTKSRPTKCRTCYNAYMREWSRANKETVNARVLRYYYANHEAKKLERKAWYEANTAKHHETVRKWKETHPDRLRTIRRRGNHVRREQLKQNGAFLIRIKETEKLYNSSCFYCGSRENIQLDHIVPISRGGRHSVGNMLPACSDCNHSKYNRFIMEWKKADKLAAFKASGEF
jgi:5-methylcytosine-specific restriction endonuclease McrA